MARLVRKRITLRGHTIVGESSHNDSSLAECFTSLFMPKSRRTIGLAKLTNQFGAGAGLAILY